MFQDKYVFAQLTAFLNMNQQAIVKFMLTDGTNPINPSAVNIQDGEDNLSLTIPSPTYTTNGNGVLYVAIPGFSGKLVLEAAVGGKTYKFTRNSH